MDIDQLRERFPDEDACREFFESSFGKIADVGHIVTAKSPIYFPGVVAALG